MIIDGLEFKATNYNHPDITEGQHTNGPARVWVRYNGGQWLNTGCHQAHKVRDAWQKRGLAYLAELEAESP